MTNNCEHNKFSAIISKDENNIDMVYALKCTECKKEFVIKPITEKDFYQIAKENDLIE